MDDDAMSQTFEQAVEADEHEDAERRYSLFKECYDHEYRTTECAEQLGLIAFNSRNDIVEATNWFIKAAELGSKKAFPYLYLVAIMEMRGERVPPEYRALAASRGTELSRAALEKVRELLNGQ